MKLQYVNYVIFIFITIPIFCSGENKLKSSSINDFDLLIQKMENPTENEIFSLSNNELNHLITTLKKEKTLIYTFGWWCEPCIEKLPGILNLKNKYKDKIDRKSTRLNSSHVAISYAVFCLKKKNKKYK